MTAEYRHTPVMLPECREALALKAGGSYCDCTLGGAGHALGLARDIVPGGTLIGIDQDPAALAAAGERIGKAHLDLRFVPLHGNFSSLDDLLVEAQVPGIDGFLFDLGVSSPQLDHPQRGFSYAREAPLDMRMDPGNRTTTAAEVIHTFNEADLTWILREYGEERWAPRIARFIVEARAQRPLRTTTELVDLVKAAIPARARRTGGNPAKRVFQALRIAVNGEMDALRCGLEAALRWLNPHGRIAVLSYHSLEDRIVKECFAQAAKGCICPPEAPVCTCGHEPILAHVTRRPLRASEEETKENPRSRSAKLRVAVKVGTR
ncbi:MAG: 16S rRNA (cytosine(1402)-N(4))-methyltransferase RsmH [Coriobacteriales bacterium]|nr:16S rRNA (cytosine(1402)-N(4))-methyltransferase RsmH [Coriobacteriales bacterium]